jgi:hypothetical protein
VCWYASPATAGNSAHDLLAGSRIERSPAMATPPITLFSGQRSPTREAEEGALAQEWGERCRGRAQQCGGADGGACQAARLSEMSAEPATPRRLAQIVGVVHAPGLLARPYREYGVVDWGVGHGAHPPSTIAHRGSHPRGLHLLMHERP